MIAGNDVNLYHLENIIGVDLDADLLEDSKDKLRPLGCQYLCKRFKGPSSARILSASRGIFGDLFSRKILRKSTFNGQALPGAPSKLSKNIRLSF